MASPAAYICMIFRRKETLLGVDDFPPACNFKPWVGSDEMNAEQIYVVIGRLVETPPFGKTTLEIQKWIGMAHAYAEEMNDPISAGKIGAMANLVTISGPNTVVVHQVLGVLYKMLATAEVKAPSSAQGAFIPAGNSFDAMAAVGKILSEASTSALIVDPYMDEKALTDFALLAKECVAIMLLTDSASVKQSLAPAAKRWKTQYDTTRPLTLKTAANPRSLHDRLIITDDAKIWTLTQSLNAFAARSPASIVRIDGDAVPLKLAAYRDFWSNGIEVN